jgi:hypothetical protein
MEIYEKGKLKEADKKYELAIREYNKAKEKFKEAHSHQELDEIFNSLIKVLMGFIRTKAYENANEVIKFIEKGFKNKSEFIKGLKENLEQNNFSIDHLSKYINEQKSNYNKIFPN